MTHRVVSVAASWRARRRAGAPWLLATMCWHVLHLALAVACSMPSVAAGARTPAHGAHRAHGAVELGGAAPVEHGGLHAAGHGAPARAPDGDSGRAGGGHETFACAAAGTCGGMVVAPAAVTAAGTTVAAVTPGPGDAPHRAPAFLVLAPEPPPPKG